MIPEHERGLLRALRRAIAKRNHTLAKALCARIADDLIRVGDVFGYHRHAHDCRVIAAGIGGATGAQLLGVARTWLDLARQRGRVPLP